MTRRNQTEGSSGTAARLMRSVDYIEHNIENRVSLAEVASQAALSEYHFHRLFRSRYGIPVMDYVRKRRLAAAARRLIETSEPIMAIALDAGFESQSAFTRAFRRMFYTSPGAYRSRSRHVPWLSVESVCDDTLSCLPGLGVLSPRLEYCSAIDLAGHTSTYTGEDRTGISDQWARLAALVGPERFRARERFGISDTTRDVSEGSFRYTSAIATGSRHEFADLKQVTVAAGRYAVFDFRGSIAQVPLVIDFLYGVWMPSSHHSLRRSPGFERYPTAFMWQEVNRFEIWLPVE